MSEPNVPPLDFTSDGGVEESILISYESSTNTRPDPFNAGRDPVSMIVYQQQVTVAILEAEVSSDISATTLMAIEAAREIFPPRVQSGSLWITLVPRFGDFWQVDRIRVNNDKSGVATIQLVLLNQGPWTEKDLTPP